MVGRDQAPTVPVKGDIHVLDVGVGCPDFSRPAAGQRRGNDIVFGKFYVLSFDRYRRSRTTLNETRMSKSPLGWFRFPEIFWDNRITIFLILA